MNLNGLNNNTWKFKSSFIEVWRVKNIKNGAKYPNKFLSYNLKGDMYDNAEKKDGDTSQIIVN